MNQPEIHTPGSTKASSGFDKKMVITLVAGILILAVVWIWLWSNLNFSDKVLAIRHLDQTSFVSVMRGNAPPPSNVYEEGMDALKQQQYAEAINFFGSVPETHEKFGASRMYMAVAQFRSEDFANAVSNAGMASREESTFQEKARWLQLNAMLAAGQTDQEFIRLLDEMATQSEDDFYRKAAQKLKDDVNAVWRNLVF